MKKFGHVAPCARVGREVLRPRTSDRAADDVSTSRRARQGDDMDEDVVSSRAMALAVDARMERRVWDGATTSERDYDGGAMARVRPRKGARAVRVGWMVWLMVAVCALAGAGGARGSENATGARKTDTKYRARHQGVDTVLKQMKNLVERQKFWIGENTRCENVKFSVGRVPDGGSVKISLKDASHLQREYELREGGVQRACLDLSEPNELVISMQNMTNKNSHATLTVEKGDGELLLMKQIDVDGRELGVSYSKMKIAPETLTVTAQLAKQFGSECEQVVFDTAFATDSGVSRDMTHRLYDGNGDLLSQWVRHASGEKKMCLLRGQTYKLKLEGSMSHGNTDQRVAVRVTGNDELGDGFAYSGTSSEALAQDDEFTYFASGDETKDSVPLHGRYSFHIPSPCGPKEAQVSVVLTASTFGDGVPPNGMSWAINDAHGKEVMAMSRPFKRGEYGVTRYESRCMPEGNYTFVASATDKRGWKFGPVLNIYQTWQGQNRRILASEGAVRKKEKHTYETPWFSSGLVSQPLEFCVNRTDVSHAHGKVERIASLASLGVSRVAPQAGVWQVSSLTFVFGTIAIIAMMVSEGSARDDEIEARTSLVKGSGGSAYGTGAPGPLDDDVSNSRPRKGKAKRPPVSRVGVMRALAAGSTLLAVVSMYQTDDGEFFALGEAATAQHSRQALCGMGHDKCDTLTAPDCKSKFMYTYRKGKLAHAPAFLLPYNSKIASGESYSLDVRFDPMECAQNGMETCDDLGEVHQQSLNGCSLACRETDACESFSLEDTRCRLCTTERLSAGGNSSVSSVARCMKPSKFAFRAISVDQCAKACDQTTLCHGFNYFEKSAGGQSHCSLLRAPSNFNAHIWRESAKTKSGVIGAATYYKTPLSNYECTARGKSVKLPALPPGLALNESNDDIPQRTTDRHYPASDHNYPNAQDEDSDDTRSDETPHESDIPEVPIVRVPYFVITSSIQLDGVNSADFEKSDALRTAFRRGIAAALLITEEDVVFLDITPNTDEDGQTMENGLHVSFSVLRTSRREADAVIVVLRSLMGANVQASVPNEKLRDYLKDAGLHCEVATVIESPTMTEPSEDPRGTSNDNTVTNRTIYAPPPPPRVEVPEKEEDSYFVLRGTMSIVGYSAAEFGDTESSQFLRGLGTFFVIGKSDATLLHVKDAPESTSENPVVDVEFQLAEKKRMKATLMLQVFILMQDRTTAQLANLAHVFKFKGLNKVTSCFMHDAPSVEMRKHQPPPPPAPLSPPMPPSPPPKVVNIERNVTKKVEIITTKLKFRTTSSVESFDETRKDAVRDALAAFISSRVGSKVPSDSIRIISISINGVEKYFDRGMSTNTSHVAAALGATDSPAEINYEVTVTEDEEEETDVGSAINSLLNDVAAGTSSGKTQSYPSDATGYPDADTNATSTDENYPSSTNATSSTDELGSELAESLNGAGLEVTNFLPSPPTNTTETVIEETVVITVPAPHSPPPPPATPAEDDEYPGGPPAEDDEYPGGINFMTLINSTTTVPGSTSAVPGSTSQDYPSSSTVPGSTSTVPGSTSQYYPSTSPTSTQPSSTSTEPSSNTHYPFSPSSGPAETREQVPGEESTEPSPTPTQHYPFTPSAGPEDTSDEIIPDDDSTAPTPTQHYPFTPSAGPEDTSDEIIPDDDSTAPTPTSTISPSNDSNATMIHEVRAGVRLFGYTMTSFNFEERGFFRRGMATFLGIAPKQVTINHVEDANMRSTRRLLQTLAIDVYYIVSTTTSQVAAAVVDETNKALNATGSGALLLDLQTAGLVLSQVTIISRPNVTVVPAPLTPAPAPAPSSAPPATGFNLSDININLNVDVTVHIDESNLSPPAANATGRSTNNYPGPSATPMPTPTPDASTPMPTPTPDASTPMPTPTPDASTAYPTPTPDASTAYPTPTPDCVPLGTETEESQYEISGSLQHEALQQAREFARENDLPMPNASTFVRAKICNAPHMKCCSELGWRRDNRLRFPFVCGDAAECARRTFQEAHETCKAKGGDLCRGNAVSTSMNDPSCPGSKTDYVWTLTKCDVNGVHGHVIRPSAGGAPGPLCETNALALHQSRCCSNVC